MESARILAFQFALSLVAYAALVRWFIGPWLVAKPYHWALMILVLPHTFRHVGVTLLVPGVVDPSLPAEFARPTAIGDTLTVVLAWTSLLSLRFRWRHAHLVVWAFNIVGCGDLLMNVLRGMRLQVADQLGAAWYGPAFIVPGMLVAHLTLFVFLAKREAWNPPAGAGPARVE